jgi:dolichyl-phosphate beta-glucosyltransferase
MHGFHFAVAIFAGGHIKDTQCGFKLFSRPAARDMFCNQHLMRWSFDVELLVIARRLLIPAEEVAVNWTEIPGSKLSVIESSFTMLRDLILIRLCYTVRVWNICTWQKRYQDCLKR